MGRIIAIIVTIVALLSPGITGALHAHAMPGMDQATHTVMADPNAVEGIESHADCCHAPLSHCNTITATLCLSGWVGLGNGGNQLATREDQSLSGRAITADPPPPRI